MFGWEFPPHISGGLGTACQGLTDALTRNNIDILFVTPNDFSNDKSEALVGDNQSSALPNPNSDPEGQPIQRGAGIQPIQIQASLNPYNRPNEKITQKRNLTQWNYASGYFQSEELNPLQDSFSQASTNPTTILDEVYRFKDNAQQLVQEFCFDLIHAHDWMTFEAAIEAKRRSGKPLIAHIHSTEYDRAGDDGSRIVYNIERQGMEEADQVFAVSERTKKIIVSRYHIDPGKVEVIHNGVQFVNNGALKDQTLTGKKLVTFLGRVTYQKGPEYFVDAAYQVHQKFPDVHFIMAGAGDLLPAMIEKVASLNMSSHFHFTGFLNPEQVEKVWRLTDVYVMPSVSEPFGITPLEAMQAGIPVIISKQSGVAEVVNQVIKIDFWNTSALAGSIGELLSKPGFANSLIKKSRREVKKISWDSTSKKIIKAYEKILAEK